MELQIPYSVCTKVPAASDLSTNQSGHREDHTTVMRNEESGDNRSGGMPGSYPHVSEYTAEYQRVAICGIFKGKKLIDDIR